MAATDNVRSLADAAADAVLHLDAAALEELPTHMLAQVLLRVNQEKQAFEARALAAEQQLAALQAQLHCRYLVDPPSVQDRVVDNMYARAEAVQAKWTPVSGDDDAAGGQHKMLSMETRGPMIQHADGSITCAYFEYDKESGKFEFYPTENRHVCPLALWSKPHIFPFDILSSPLLLYRLCCLFAMFIDTRTRVDRYKSVWSAELEHRATRMRMRFGEHKGAIQVYLAEPMPKQYADDARDLLNLLFDPCCPHTYDGTVAGSVA